MALYRDPYLRSQMRSTSLDTLAESSGPAITGEEIDREVRRNQAAGRTDFQKSVAAGIGDIKTSLLSARGLLRVGVGDEEGGLRDFERAQQNDERSAEFGARVQSFDQIEGVGDALEYAGNSLGRLSPTIAATLATGFTAGAARVGVGAGAKSVANRMAANGLGRAIADDLVDRRVKSEAEKLARPIAGLDPPGLAGLQERATRRVAQRISAARAAEPSTIAKTFESAARKGALASSIVMQAGAAPDIVLDPEGEGSVQERAFKAGVGAVATGSLEALPIFRLLKTYGLGETAEKALTGSLVERVAKEATKQGGAEAATEVAQTFGERLTHKWVNDNVELLSDEAMTDYINAAAGGFIGGGVFGAPGGLRGAKLDSAAGKKYAESFRDWSGRFRRTDTPPPTDPNAPPAPAGAAADPDVAFDLSDIGARVKQATSGVADLGKGFAKTFESKLGEVSKSVDDVMRRFTSDELRENSISEILEAPTYDFKSTPTGVMFNDGNGIKPAKNLIGDAAQMRQWRAAGLDPFAASAAAMLDPSVANELLTTGAVDEAGKLLRGEDPSMLDDAKITAFQNALPDGQRTAFNRTAHTIWQSRNVKDEIELAPENAVEGVDDGVTRPPADPAEGDFQQKEAMGEEQSLPANDARVAAWKNKAAKVAGTAPSNAVVLTDDKGTRRALTGESLGKLIVEARREDPVFAKMKPLEQVASVLGDFVRNGQQIDAKTLKAMKLGSGWMLTQQQATTLANGLARSATPEKLTLRAQSAQSPAARTKGKAEERALNEEFGQSDSPGTAGNEDTARLDDDARALERAPIVGGTPRTAVDVTAEGRVREGRAADAGDVDTDAQRAEREPDDFNALDSLLERYTGRKVAGDRDVRRELYETALGSGRVVSQPARGGKIKSTIDPATGKLVRLGAKRVTKPLSKAERAELIDAANRYADAVLASAVKKRASARKKYDTALQNWQGNKNPKTKAALATARQRLQQAERDYAAADEAANKRGTERSKARAPVTTDRQSQIDADNARAGGKQTPLPGPTPLEREGARQRAAEARTKLAQKKATPASEETREDSVNADRATIEAQTEQAVANRSRRDLYALRDKIMASAMPAKVKEVMLEEIGRQLNALGATIRAAGIAESSYNNRRTMRADMYSKLRAALVGKPDLEAALRTLSEDASPEQRALIDSLLASSALKGVSFTLLNTGRAGDVKGVHISGTKRGTTLNSRVELSMASEASITNVDPIAVLLHEAMHAATSHAEATDDKARAELKDLLDYVRAEARKLGYDPDALYGLSETQEFVAEAFTNVQLQNLLRQIKSREGNRSLWDVFKDFVARITGADRSALDDVMELGAAMARETGAARAEAYAAIFADTSVEGSIGSAVATPAAGGQPTDFMGQLKPNERRYLEALFGRGDVFAQIKAALPPDRYRELASADLGPTLLVNTGIALALQGKLDISRDAGRLKSAVGGLWEIISTALGVPSKAAYGRAALSQLTRGVGAANVNARAQLLSPRMQRLTRTIEAKVTPVVKALSADMDSRMRSTGVPALTQLATLLSQRTGEFRADGKTSLSAATLAERGRRLNEAFKIMGDWDEATKKRVLKELQEAKAEVSPEAAALRGYLRDMYQYLRSKGLPVGKTEDYFPVQISPEAIVARREEFLALLDNFSDTIRKRETAPLRKKLNELIAQANKRGPGSSPNKPAFTADEAVEAKRLRALLRSINNMTPRQLSERVAGYAEMRLGDSHVGDLTFTDGEHQPSFRPMNARVMDYIYKEGTPEQIAQFATFQDQNLERVIVAYTNRAVRRAEWSGLGLETKVVELLAKAEEQGATPAQLQLARDHVDMMMGVYGSDWNPYIKRIAEKIGVQLPPFEKFQKVSTALTTYQNLRLLPLAAMSSLIDPLGVAVRNGSTRGVFKAYRDAAKALRNAQGDDSLRSLAESMGLVERHAVSEALIHMYGSINDPTGTSAKINSVLFRYNGLEHITKFSRLAALAAGNNFLKFHAARADAESIRYLSELGLKIGDIQTGTDGYVVRNEKIDAALNRFVNEAVVRPTPGQRPGWQNDPNFAIAAQYKGYLYSFFNTVSRRGLLELKNGNMGVLAPLIIYLPVTALGEVLRDMLQGDGEEKEADDYAKLAVMRSGLLGPHVGLINDLNADMERGTVLFGLAGPTGSQIGKAYQAVTQSGAGGGFIESSLPGSALYSKWD